MVRRIHFLALVITMLAAARPAPASHLGTAHDDEPVVAIWRPLMADPREAEFKMQWLTYHESWRYGTDVGNPASTGGYVPQHGVYWDVAFGGNFHLYAGGADTDKTGHSTLHQL